jgi:hypothetical protein
VKQADGVILRQEKLRREEYGEALLLLLLGRHLFA